MISKNKLLESIHAGIWNAHMRYKDWAGGWWMSGYSIEGFMTANIAEQIMTGDASSRTMYLTLETTFKDLRDNESIPTSRGRKTSSVKDGNKVDIAIYSKAWELNYIIEVKRAYPWNHRACLADIRRLRDLSIQFARNGGKIKAAVFTHYIWCKKSSTKEVNPKKDLFDPYCEKHFGVLVNALDYTSKGLGVPEHEYRLIDQDVEKDENGKFTTWACGSLVFAFTTK